jgi:DNA-binding transcriptional regulator/RsmH inhibitor MraZ
VRCDKTGRIRVPDALLASIGVDRNESNRREVVLVGGFSEIRVWSPLAWDGFGTTAREDFGAGLDALLGGGVPELRD